MKNKNVVKAFFVAATLATSIPALAEWPWLVTTFSGVSADVLTLKGYYLFITPKTPEKIRSEIIAQQKDKCNEYSAKYGVTFTGQTSASIQSPVMVGSSWKKGSFALKCVVR